MTPIRCGRPASPTLAEMDGVDVVEKQEYLKLLDEVMELRVELDRVKSATPRDASQQPLSDITNNSAMYVLQNVYNRFVIISGHQIHSALSSRAGLKLTTPANAFI